MEKDQNGIIPLITRTANLITNKNIFKTNFLDKKINLNIRQIILEISEAASAACLTTDSLNLLLKEPKKFSKKHLEKMNCLKLDSEILDFFLTHLQIIENK